MLISRSVSGALFFYKSELLLLNLLNVLTLLPPSPPPSLRKNHGSTDAFNAMLKLLLMLKPLSYKVGVNAHTHAPTTPKIRLIALMVHDFMPVTHS